MRGGHGERPLVAGERGAGGEVWFVHGQPVAQDIDVAMAQGPVGVEGLYFLELDLAGGVTGVERGDQPAECGALGGQDEADAQQPADVTGQVACLGERLFQGRQRRSEPAAEFFAGRGKPDPPARPVEDLDAKT